MRIDFLKAFCQNHVSGVDILVIMGALILCSEAARCTSGKMRDDGFIRSLLSHVLTADGLLVTEAGRTVNGSSALQARSWVWILV